ncbi:MAG: DUF4203 domain-containing protein [Propioniciclava sp.]|uniref:TM7S3/TM198-like domain-containing protein n=1 Tax=Propioniciclava sp. TaxID=2038686 RepID=UPI0039E3DC4B
MVIGLVTLLIGLFFCFRGQPLVRVALTVWGALIGFSLATGLLSSASGGSALSAPHEWVIACVTALVFGVLVHAFYTLGVLVAAGSVGASLATTVSSLAGWADGTTRIAPWVGAAILVVIALAVNLADLLIVLVSAIGGALAIVRGAALVLHRFDTGDFDTAVALLRAGWPPVVFALFAIAGAAAQLRRRQLSR